MLAGPVANLKLTFCPYDDLINTCLGLARRMGMSGLIGIMAAVILVALIGGLALAFFDSKKHFAPVAMQLCKWVVGTGCIVLLAIAKLF